MIASLVAIASLVLEPSVWTFDVAGQSRTAYVIEGQKDGPVVLAFHGHGGNGRQTANRWGMHDLMPEATFIYPNGLNTATPRDPEGLRPGWQTREGQEGNRDVAFVEAIREKAGKERPTLLIGHSNGAGFSVFLWGRQGADYRGVVEIAGGGRPSQNGLSIPMMVVAGREDRVVPFENQQAFVEGMKRVLAARQVATSGHLTKYESPSGVPFWTYLHPGDHSVPNSCRPHVVAFFRMCLERNGEKR